MNNNTNTTATTTTTTTTNNNNDNNSNNNNIHCTLLQMISYHLNGREISPSLFVLTKPTAKITGQLSLPSATNSLRKRFTMLLVQ